VNVLAASFVISIGLLSCASPVLLSGEALVPQRRAQLRALTGMTFVRIDEKAVDGRWYIVRPGEHELELRSRRDSKAINPALEGMVKELSCTIEVNVRPGEELHFSSKLKKGKPRYSEGFSKSNFYTEILLESSIEGSLGILDTSQCRARTDCKKVDRRRVFARGCDP